jgi:hypothetical protein
VTATTELLFNDRSPATLGDITPGDTVNIYGYYTDDGGIQAEIIRDISQPGQSQSQSSGGGTGEATGGGESTTATLQAELDQLEALVAQLESEVAGNMSAASTTMATATPASTSTAVSTTTNIY